MARTGTAWPRAPPLMSFDCFYRPFLPSVNLNFPYFSLTPNNAEIETPSEMEFQQKTEIENPAEIVR